LDDREEQFAESYIRTAKANSKLSDAVKLMQRRATRGDFPQPTAVRNLWLALVERGEQEYASAALEKALEKHSLLANASKPAQRAHGELLLFRAEQHANAADFSQAREDLDRAKPLAEPILWAKTAARIARIQPNFQAALGHLGELLLLDPLNSEAHRLTIGLLIETAGKQAVFAHLNDICSRYPNQYALLKLRSEYFTAEPGDAGIRATQQLVELNPADAWAHRQLALAYSDQRRHVEALQAVQEAGRLEPDHPSHFAVLANVHRRADRSEEAIAAFREGLGNFIDHELAITEYLRTARGLKEKKSALRFIAEQLHEQPHNGEGLLAYRDQALALIDDPEEQERFHAELERFLEERPDLWHCWSIVIQQLLMMHRADEAHALARNATEDFPLISRLWLDLAEACRATDQPEERINALRQAIDTAPGWIHPVKELAEALIEAEEDEEATAALRKHLSRTPLDPLGYGFLAERLWESGSPEEALHLATRAVRHEPGYDWAWGSVASWGERLDEPDAVVELARDLVKDRAGDPRVWMKLARALHRFEQSEEALAALDQAIALDPKNPDPYDLKSERLTEMGRFDEALETTKPAALIDELPLTLQGRAAWIEARRGNFAAAIPPMQALVSVDPDYYWGWQQLAEWYNDTGRSEAYLEAAGELCRLRPDHPTPLTMRGEAKLQMEDREGGKADLRDALRLHPGYSPAAAILFDACLADDELKEARSALAVLQEHMDGPEGLVKQITYAVRTDDEEAAVRAFRLICEHAVESSPTVLQMGMMELRSADWEARAFEQMGEAWRSGEPFNPWAGLLWLDTPPAEMTDLEDRLAACQAVLREFPNFVPAHDRYAEQLARGSRFDDAITACSPAHLVPTPITLRGRAAWITALRGNRSEAIEMMRKTVAEDHDYAWGWRQITHWADDLGRHKDCLEAADVLVRLAPDDPYSYGIRGEAKRQLGDHRGALDDYQKAYELDPTFVAVGQQLLNEQLATDDLSGAAGTLEQLREQASGPLLKLRAVQLAARKKTLVEAGVALRDLATDGSTSRGMLRDALAAWDEAGWASDATAELGNLLPVETATPAAGACGVERMMMANQGQKVADRLKSLVDENPDVGREVVLVYAWGLAITQQPEIATATVQRFADLLRETPDGWARAGGILCEARRYPLAVAWLSDYTKRDQVEAWMLKALADSQRALGNDAEAESTLRAADDFDDDTMHPEMMGWLALGHALRGEIEPAAELLTDVERVGMSDSTRLVFALCDGLLLVQEASAGEKALAFSEVKEDWKAAAGACALPEVPVGLARWYQKCVQRIVADTGGIKAKLWGFWQKISPLVKEQ